MKKNRQQLVLNVLKEVYGIEKIIKVRSQSAYVYVAAKVVTGRVQRFSHPLQSPDRSEDLTEKVFFDVYFDKLKSGEMCVKFKTFGMHIAEDRKESILARAREYFPEAKVDIYNAYLFHRLDSRPVLRMKFPQLP